MIDPAGFVRVAVTAFSTEIVRTLRDRRVLVLLVLMPVGIAAVVVYALGGDDDRGPVTLGVVVADDTPVSRTFVDSVVSTPELEGVVDWAEFSTVSASDAALDDGDVGAALAVRSAADAVDLVSIEIRSDEDPIASGVAATIVDVHRVRHATARLAAEQGLSLVEDIGDDRLVIAAPAGASLDAAVHWGPALGIFFVLLGMGHAAHRQVDDRNRGVDGRFRATVSGPGPVIVGRALAATAIGAASLLAMAAATHLLFGRPWGPWPQVVVVALLAALAVAGVGAIVAALSTTTGRAQSMTALAAFGLGIAGGSFSPQGAGGAPSGVSSWLPTSLTLDAFGTATTTGSWNGMVRPAAGLVVTGVVLLVLGARLGSAHRRAA